MNIKIVMFKAIFMVLVLSMHVNADELKINEKDLYKNIGTNIIISTLDARLQASCLTQINSDNSHYISNKPECSREVNQQINVIKDDSEMIEYLVKLELFKGRFQL